MSACFWLLRHVLAYSSTPYAKQTQTQTHFIASESGPADGGTDVTIPVGPCVVRGPVLRWPTPGGHLVPSSAPGLVDDDDDESGAVTGLEKCSLASTVDSSLNVAQKASVHGAREQRLPWTHVDVPSSTIGKQEGKERNLGLKADALTSQRSTSSRPPKPVSRPPGELARRKRYDISWRASLAKTPEESSDGQRQVLRRRTFAMLCYHILRPHTYARSLRICLCHIISRTAGARIGAAASNRTAFSASADTKYRTQGTVGRRAPVLLDIVVPGGSRETQ